jgi:hypothetical protein
MQLSRVEKSVPTKYNQAEFALRSRMSSTLAIPRSFGMTNALRMPCAQSLTCTNRRPSSPVTLNR